MNPDDSSIIYSYKQLNFLMQKIKIPYLFHFLIALSLAYTLSFNWISSSSAQSAPGYIREVRKLETDEVGIRNPVGLAYSEQAKAFHVIEASRPSSPSLGQTDIVTISTFADQKGSARIAASITDPINTAFDNRYNRLLIFQPNAKQLISVDAAEDGQLDPRTLTHNDARNFNLGDPQGMAVNPYNGDLFILDNSVDQILIVETNSGSFEGAALSRIDLPELDGRNLRGLAFDQGTDNLQVYDLDQGNLYEVTVAGQVVGFRDLSDFNIVDPQAMVIAPSGDQTDDPSRLNLYLADSGTSAELIQVRSSLQSSVDALAVPTVQSATGEIVEFSFLEIAAVETTTEFTSTLVQTIHTYQWNPPSPDPSGIIYLPSSDHLMVVDGEVDEMQIYAGANVFESTRPGNLVTSYTTLPWSNEPTGISLNLTNQHLLISQDTPPKIVYDVDPGPNGTYFNSDDVRTSFVTMDFGSGDPEGVTYANGLGVLFFVDGVNSEVYRVDPGPNGLFDGIGDVVTSFDTESLGMIDPEGIAYNPDNGNLYIAGKTRNIGNVNFDTLLEVTTSGNLVQTIDVSDANANKLSGLAYAPCSNNPSLMCLYIVDRAVDNNSDPNENDGEIYVMSLPGGVTNSPPVAIDDSANTSQNTLVTIDVAVNDSDPNGNLDPATTNTNCGTCSGTSPGSSLVNNGDGTFDYTPPNNFTGSDGFVYEICDSGSPSLCDTANVSIMVTVANDPPVANIDSVTTDEDVQALIDVAANDTDPDGNLDPTATNTTCSTCSETSNGALANNGNGTFNYTPDANFNGSDTFTYEICDDLGACDTASVNITVNPVDDPPVAVNDSASTSATNPVMVDVAINDTDPDGNLDPTSANTSCPGCSGSGNGTLVNNLDGTFTYTADLGFIGNDSFIYEVCDTTSLCDTATANITVSEQQLISTIYLSSNGGGTAGGVAFKDEDILAYDYAKGTYSMQFDGSDVGLGGAGVEIDGFHINTDGSILISVDPSTTLPDVGSIDDTDIVRFIPTSLGDNTAGSYEMYFDGSDVGLDADTGDDIDGLGIAPDGSLLISARGHFDFGTISGIDTDLLKFNATSLGDTTSGSWELYFDGLDVGIGDGGNNEDVTAVWIAPNGDIYLSARIDFSVDGVTGDSSDIFVCEPGSLGQITVCTFSMFWDGSENGFVGQNLNGMTIETTGGPANSYPTVSINTPAYGSTYNQGDNINFSGIASDNEDGDLSANILWESDLAGIIGTGSTLAISNLPIGVQTISATITDSGGLSSDSIAQITVFGQANVLVGAGDIADCRYNEDEDTAKLLESIPGTVVTLGDNVYPDGTTLEFADCYDPTWGRHITRTRPAPGNHDYNTIDATGYYNYFGTAAGDPTQGYYSYDIGDWHIITLNSECDSIGGCGPASPQYVWLEADLAANNSICTLAYWHEPLFSSGINHGPDTRSQYFWQLLYNAGADVVLNGHEHHYERFALQDPLGNADPYGIREFVVGTGGSSLYPFNITPAPNSEARNNTTQGVLKLTLNPTSYDWEFVPIAGQTFTDSGSANCVSPALPDNDAPSLVNNTGSTVAEGGTDLIPNTELMYDDLQPTASISYLVTAGPTNGQLELTGNPGVSISTFSQADIDANSLVYVHDGSNTISDSFNFEVSDGVGNTLTGQSFAITITPVDNDPPTLVNNTGSTVAEGGTDPIPNTELQYVDAESPGTVSYAVTSAPVNGQLELTSNPGVAISAFSQADIDANSLVYVHDGSNTISDSFDFEVSDGPGNTLPGQSFSITVTTQQNLNTLYISSTSGGSVDGISFTDGDILAYNLNSDSWSLYFDGSNVGLNTGGQEIDALYIDTDGSILLSLGSPGNLPGLPNVDDYDIVRFTPISLGENNTQGNFTMYFNGEDHELTANGEDIDAIGFAPDGRLVISTRGSYSVSGFKGGDEDLLIYNDISGAWELYLDGTDVGLEDGGNSEDINGIWIDPNGDIYMSVRGSYSVPGAVGDADDIFVCTPTAPGDYSSCTFNLFWDGATTAFAGEVANGFHLGQ